MKVQLRRVDVWHIRILFVVAYAKGLTFHQSFAWDHKVVAILADVFHECDLLDFEIFRINVLHLLFHCFDERRTAVRTCVLYCKLAFHISQIMMFV